jgi:hypothetical protein
MSLAAAVLFDRALKQTRRASLREQGLVPRPLPQIRMIRWIRAPRETYGAWSLMLLEGVRTLDEAVEEVREDKRQKEIDLQRRREEERLERARIKAITGQRGLLPSRGGRQVELPSGSSGGGGTTMEPALEAETADRLEISRRSERPALSPVRGEKTTIDLTSEDDTLTIPKLDSLERKLADLERQYG